MVQADPVSVRAHGTRHLPRFLRAAFVLLMACAASPATAAITMPCGGFVDGLQVPLRALGARMGMASASAAPLALSPTYLPYAYNGEYYAETITASGGTGPYTFAVTAGALPPGLVLAASGLLDGVPTVDGTFAFTITATDALGVTGSLAYTLDVGTVATIVVSPASVPDGTVDVPYDVSFSASGGTGPYTFECYGALPPGLSMAVDGTLGGTPTETGTWDFTIAAVDANGDFGTRDYTLQVDAAEIVLSPTALPDGTVGVAYEQPLAASGGNGPYSFAVTAGALPAGMAMDGDGIVDGTPEEAGSFGFTVTATDAFEQSGEQAYTLVIAAPVIGITPTDVPDATVGVDYEVVFDASGGVAPYTFALTAGTLPPGLFLSSDGTLNGAPTTVGDYAFTVTATDNFNQTGEQSYDITVQAATITVTPATLPAATVGTAYEQPLSADGGTAPYSFSLGTGALPAGMGMDGDGIVDGTPEEAGTFAFTAVATDAFGQTGERAYTLVVAAPDIEVSPATLADATVGEDYATTFAASGGNGPYTFAVTSGTLPPGMFLDSDGPFHGTPAAAGDYAFTVTAIDNFDQAGTRSYTLHVEGAVITLSPGSVPEAVVGMPYQQAFEASGGTEPYSFEVTSGALPPGVTMDGDGIVDGTPEAAGTFAFTVTATDAFAQTGEQSYALVVAAPDIVLTPSTLPDGIVGEPYQQALSASGGTAPYVFSVADGELPPGMALSADGSVSGTPTVEGSYGFTIAATDAFEQGAEQGYVLAVSAPALPDPTEDPDVVGLLTSQVSTVRTFATSQIANVHDRLETLHGGGGQGWGFWVAGSFRSGDRDGTGDVSPMSFETSGMTGGSDYRLNDTFAFGGGLGFARDRTAVGNDGSRNDGEAPSGVSYMSWHPEELPFFLDGMGGYQRLEFDVQRASAGGMVYEGRRLGRQRFSSWSGGYEHRTEAFLFSPYARFDAASADLHGFREQGDDPLALQFGPQSVDLRTTTLGFRMKYRTEVEWGVLEPRLRVEFQRDFHDEDGVSIRYANQASSPVFVTTPAGLDRSRIVLELGTVLRTNWYDLLVRVDYLGVFGGYNDSEHMVRFSFQED